MFKKNWIGFFVGLDYYLYYFTVAVLLGNQADAMIQWKLLE